jgi:hypothetical protein
LNKPFDVKIFDMKKSRTSGVSKYWQMGYWEPDNIPKNTGVLKVLSDAAGRVRPQEAAPRSTVSSAAVPFARIAHQRSAIRRTLFEVADSRGNHDRFATHASPRSDTSGIRQFQLPECNSDVLRSWAQRWQ